MKPTQFYHSSDKPTLNVLITVLNRSGVKCAAMVSPPDKEISGALCILCLSEDSICTVGSYLRARFANVQQNDDQKIMIDGNSHIATVFRAMEQLSLQFAWTYLNQDRARMVFFIVGPQVNETLAAELTHRGCIVNLK